MAKHLKFMFIFFFSKTVERKYANDHFCESCNRTFFITGKSNLIFYPFLVNHINKENFTQKKIYI